MQIPNPGDIFEVFTKFFLIFVSTPPLFNLIVSLIINIKESTWTIIIIEYFNLVENSSKGLNKSFVVIFKLFSIVNNTLIIEILSSLFDHANWKFLLNRKYQCFQLWHSQWDFQIVIRIKFVVFRTTSRQIPCDRCDIFKGGNSSNVKV